MASHVSVIEPESELINVAPDMFLARMVIYAVQTAQLLVIETILRDIGK
jgi:hypothetical protein